ncbi:MRN complex-interacting protein [Maniola hyperantus]|uniref:MRN complex-interacting protein n=1 Tax=Aphantopus hyperantus TaxID=2795564 RepID=UPI0015699DB4|nr:MRN complex-interacting protein [Maniola hyperantus]
MPQVFQVLKCYKCSVFQVHQTKKDNKWKCKMCGEKQSVKRHYGIGRAKDCRMHVQKLNNLRGNIEEFKLKTIDSEDSDYEADTENVDKINNTSGNSKKESKWLAYVEKEKISVVKEPEYIDNVEACLELPQKRKINRKSKPFKVPKVSNECNEKNEIVKKLLTRFNTDELNTFNHKDSSTDLNYKNTVRYELESSKEKNEAINKNVQFKTNKGSKWEQYIADDTETDDQYIDVDNNENYIEHYDDDKAENDANNYQQEEKYYQQNVMGNDIENTSNGKETEVPHKLVSTNNKINKILFSLCDDNDLDNILEI